MKINIKATGLDLTPSIQEYVEKKVESLEKFISVDPGNILAEIEVGKISRHHKSGDVFRAEVNLSFAGENIYADAKKDDLYSAIDEMKDKIERECISLKKKKMTLMKRGEVIIKKMIHRSR